MMYIFSVSLLFIMLGGCWAATHFKNAKLSYICILVALILNIMSTSMIYVDRNREVNGYQKLIKKISAEVKKGNGSEATSAIDESFQSSEKIAPGNIWLSIQSKINMSKSSK